MKSFLAYFRKLLRSKTPEEVERARMMNVLAHEVLRCLRRGDVKRFEPKTMEDWLT